MILRTPSAEASAAWSTASASPERTAASTLAAPSATAPALRASPSEPSAALASSRSTMSPRSAGTWTSAFSARANSFFAAARSTCRRSAVTQQPRPGRFLFRSGTRAESGPTTNRMRSSGAPLLRVTMHVRSFISSKGYSGRYRAHVTHRRFPRPAASSAAARSSSVIQPAFSRAAMTICSASSRDTRMIGEHAGEELGLAVLAFLPADQVVDGIAGEILDRLHAVLAERHHHGGGDARDFAQLVGDAEFLALVVMLGLDALEIFAGARLDFAKRCPRRSRRSRRFRRHRHRPLPRRW